MARQIFISHSSADRDAAQAICVALEAGGTGCWIAPRDIAAGADWAGAIMAGIAEARLLLVVHSAATAGSDMVLREVSAAFDRQLPVLPVRIDAALPQGGLRFFLGASHWFDAHSGGLATHLPRLVAAAADTLAAARPPAPVPSLPAFEDQPAIAVLPFRAVGEADAYLADGLTEELTAAVAAWRIYPVISRRSVAAQAGGSADARLLGRLLGARYLVGGAIRRDGTRLRVVAELTDSGTGAVLLSAPLDVAGEDTETSVDAIATAISGALGPEVAKAERERAARRPVADASVHELVRRGMWHRHRETREDLAAAEALFAQAVEAEPRNALALSAWSIARNFAAIRGWPQDVPAAFREAMALARRALEADPRDPQAHFAVGLGHMNLGQREEAVAAFEDVIRLNPSFAGARANLGQMLNYLDRPEEAMAHLQLAFRLSPHDPFGYQWLPYIAASHYLSARYRDCLAAARQALEARPSYPLAIRYAVAAMGQLGRTEGVEPLLAEMRRVDIDLAHLSVHARRMFVPSAANRLIEGFAKAGFA